MLNNVIRENYLASRKVEGILALTEPPKRARKELWPFMMIRGDSRIAKKTKKSKKIRAIRVCQARDGTILPCCVSGLEVIQSCIDIWYLLNFS